MDQPTGSVAGPQLTTPYVLPPRQVARRLGVPVKTVTSRLARGLERLRASWKREHAGGGRMDLSALAALALPPGASLAPGAFGPLASGLSVSTSALPLGFAVMNAKLVLVLVAVVLAGGLFWLFDSTWAPPATPAAVTRAADRSIAQPRTAEPPELARENETARAAVHQPTGESDLLPEAAAAAPARRLVHGRVLDPMARSLAGVEVCFEPHPSPTEDRRGGAARAVSASDGRFELAIAELDGEVRATDPELVTVLSSSIRAESEVELLIVVAPHRDLSGVVVDGTGAYLENARVRMETPPGFLARFDSVLDAARLREWSVLTDESGAFGLEHVPILGDSTIVASLEGFVPASQRAPSGEQRGLELVLRRPSGESMLAGRVVSADLGAVSGALVSLGAGTAVTDPNGEFRIDASAAPDARELVAVHPGYLPARVMAADDAVTSAPLWPDYVVLELGGPPLSLAGIVADQHGTPCEGMRIWLREPTEFGVHRDDVVAHVENLLASETLAQGDGYWGSVSTDAEGRFRLRGLLEQEYELQVMDMRSLQTITAGPFRAGDQDARILFERGAARPLAGRVLSTRGQAIPGVQVQLCGHTFGGCWENGGTSVTDEQGRFRFEGIGGGDMMLWLRGDGVVPLTHHLDRPTDEEILITMAVRCHLKVDLSHAPDAADRIRLLDSEGNRLEVYEITPSGVTTMGDLDLLEGRTATFGVSETASTLLLLKGSEEVGRVPLSLKPGQLNVVVP